MNDIEKRIERLESQIAKYRQKYNLEDCREVIAALTKRVEYLEVKLAFFIKHGILE